MKVSAKTLFDNNRFVQIFSLAAAALCWLLVAMTQSYTTTEIIRGVPVKLDQQSAALESIGLHAIDSDEILVDVEVEGLRSVVGQLSPEDLLITARLTGVTEAGAYDLTLTSAKQSPNPDYEIKSYSPSTVRVSFDRIVQRTLTIGEEINGLAIAPGYTEKTTVITPGSVTIEGPSAEMEKIARCALRAELEAPLDRTYAGDFPIILYDANGDVLDPDAMRVKMDSTEAQLMIQVLKITNLPLEVGFINPPRGFPTDELMARTDISQLDVTLAGPADLVDKINEIQVGYIDVKSISLDNNAFYFEVPLPSPSDQFMRLDNITDVIVTIDDDDLSSATFNVPAPQIMNIPFGFEVEVLANTIENVEFVGKSEIFQTMTSGDIVTEIDLSEREIVSGSYNLPVKISVPGKGLVWAVGDHSITVQVNDTRTEQ